MEAILIRETTNYELINHDPCLRLLLGGDLSSSNYYGSKGGSQVKQEKERRSQQRKSAEVDKRVQVMSTYRHSSNIPEHNVTYVCNMHIFAT